MRPLARGFSLLEMMVVVALIGLLLSVGVPSFFTWTQNMQIRAGAEALNAGLQIAKNEAIRRNTQVQLALEAGSTWRINLASDPEGIPLQRREADEGSANVTVELLPNGTNVVTFNGMGRIVAVNADGTPALTQIDLDNPQISSAADRRKLRIVIPVGGAVRMCDPNPTLPVTDPRACPI